MRHFPEAHLKWWLPRCNTRQRSHRAYPLREKGMPAVQLGQLVHCQSRRMAVHRVVHWLDVENSARYRRSGETTYCNIYVHDLAYCLGAYIPRVWWHEDVIPLILQGRSIKAKYGITVSEQNSNALAGWFEQYGSYYNWKRGADAAELQNRANAGSLGIIVAQRAQPEKPGHITAVIPEKGPLMATRLNGEITAPLQSQAGEQNKKYSNELWWNDAKFEKVGYWYLVV